MQPIKRHFVTAFVAIGIASLATFAFALPGPIACLLAGMADLHELPNGILAESTSEDDRARYVQLTRDARAQIEAAFGTVEARPILVYFETMLPLRK